MKDLLDLYKKAFDQCRKFNRARHRFYVSMADSLYSMASIFTMLPLLAPASGFSQRSSGFYFRQMDYQGLRENYRNYRTVREAGKTIKEIRDIFEDNDPESDEETSALITGGPQESPPFPIFILSAALFKDILDVAETATVVGSVLTWLSSFFIAVILFFWCFNKISGGYYKRPIIRRIWKGKIWRRYILAIIIEFIPGFNIVPVETIFVLMAYYRERKIVKLFNLALEKLHKLEKLNKIKFAEFFERNAA